MTNKHGFLCYDLPSDISKEELNALPKAVYHGRIILVDNEHKAKSAVKALREHSVLGLDTESRPNFVPGRKTAVSLLQIAMPEVCFLFRLNIIGIPPELKALLEDEEILKVGLSLHDDMVGLKRLAELEPRAFVEIQRLAPAYGLQCASLQKLYAVLCGAYMSKKQRTTNWEAELLTKAQLQYAALDAHASLEIYRRLMSLPEPKPTQFGFIQL